MIGLGTLVNTGAVVLGGCVGLALRKGLPQRLQTAIMTTTGLAVVLIGIAGVLERMLVVGPDAAVSTQGTLMFVVSLVLGAIVGELLNLEALIVRFGEWLKVKTKSEGDNSFVSAFVSASLTVCVGAMAIVGALEDGLEGDPTLLYTKALLDMVIICIMASSQGKGCIFSALPIFLFQGSVTLLAKASEDVLTQAAIANMAMVGSAMVLCVGLNLMFDTKIKVANLLPALIPAALWGLV